ncbi:MAG: histidinol dehydrogenase [Firmicutes bacterium]|nr:histidinol dehydrogenase [Bacillota bacterium]
MIRVIDGRNKDTKWIEGSLNRPSQLELGKEKDTVDLILKGVRERGDMALLEYTKEFDKVDFGTPDAMLVSEEEIQEAYNLVDERYLEVLRRARERISNFHQKQRQNTWMTFEEEDIILGQKISPLERVGVYVPGGRAAYPSSVLMNVIPAKVAGVKEIIMATPPKVATPPKQGGKVSPAVLVAAREAGVDKIYKVGGAQAIAALAFGTNTIPKVDKIVGPGNIYVALAKKEVYGHVDIDMIAGPSEVLVIADETANASYVAADLMSQAEHDPMASAILLTDSEKLIKDVLDELTSQVEHLSMKETILSSLKNYGALILVDSIKEAIKLSDAIAPEHLELSVENPMEWVGNVHHAGAIFLGHYSPEPLGDYMAGPNHVLPTSGTARFFSPLSVDDFVKKSSVISFTQGALESIYKDVADFARVEGLTAHANAMEVRFKKK